MEKFQHRFSLHHVDGRLRTRAASPASEPEPGAGTYILTTPNGQEAQFHVPANYDSRHLTPLIAIFHGANGRDGGALATAIAWADRHGALLIAQKSMESTWDILRGGYGADLTFTDFLLTWAMQRYAIDPSRIGIAGFSDGASYALSVGLTNGDLFHDILAYSPGFMQPHSRTGKPRIFVSHGISDTILPVDCGRRIAHQLVNEGYEVRYDEFDGGHHVPPDVAEAALNRFVNRP